MPVPRLTSSSVLVSTQSSSQPSVPLGHCCILFPVVADGSIPVYHWFFLSVGYGNTSGAILDLSDRHTQCTFLLHKPRG